MVRQEVVLVDRLHVHRNLHVVLVVKAMELLWDMIIVEVIQIIAQLYIEENVVDVLCINMEAIQEERQHVQRLKYVQHVVEVMVQ